MVDKDQKEKLLDEGFDTWLRAEALEPPKAPEGEWQAIAAAIQNPAHEPPAKPSPLKERRESSLWSFTWPSLVAAAIPLLLLLGGGQNVAPTLANLASLASSVTTTAAGDQAAVNASEQDDQLWLSSQEGQGAGLDVLISGDSEPLVVESP